MYDYDKIAAIVGEDKINALREAGVEIADKPVKLTTNLLGRWAKDKNGVDVLITSNHPTPDGKVWVSVEFAESLDGTKDKEYSLSDLMFPEETTRPEDVPAGEAWLANIDDGKNSAQSVAAIKAKGNCWRTAPINGTSLWYDTEVTLVSPLVPARPIDTHREPETVTTEEEYAALPAGTIVAEPHGYPFLRRGIGAAGIWVDDDDTYTHLGMARTERQVLRRGWE